MHKSQNPRNSGTNILDCSSNSISEEPNCSYSGNKITAAENSTPDIGNVLCTHDGVLLKQAAADFICELNASGSLNLVKYEYPCEKLFIEWRQNENILITDEDTQEQWALVDTISNRQRTISESKIFNTKCELPPKSRCLKVELNELKSIEVMSKGHIIRLLKKTDGCIHSEYMFQHGNADIFVRSLQQLQLLEKSNNKKVYDILKSESEKLKKTFAELQIDEIKESGGWLSNIVWRNIDLLAKVTDYGPQGHHDGRQQHQRNSPRMKNDDYEVLYENKSKQEQNNSENCSFQVLPNTLQVEKSETATDRLPERKIIQRGSPLTEKQWHEFQTEDGRISDPERIKEIIFRGGIEHQLRCEVWKYLLNYYQWNDTAAERIERRRNKSAEYYQMKAQWLSMTITQERNFSGYRDRKCQIDKDVKRTDRTQDFFAGEENPNLAILQDILMTYVMYNFDLGYVQGMSDLLAPILWVQQNEVDAFWCFVGFMNIVFLNFDIDQAGMKRQLNAVNRLLELCNNELFKYLKTHGSENMYFCFRWLLVWFKREFSLSDILELWECLWTALPGQNFHLFFCIAILEQQKDTIMSNGYEFNEILKHINELSMKIDLRRTLELAEGIYNQIKSSENLSNEIKMIIGDKLLLNEKDKDNELNDSFDDLREPTQEELETRQQKLEDACDQSMFLSFL